MYIYLGLILFMSFITYILYKIDKNKAQKNKWRIKERTLLLFTFLLGALGGLLAMYQLRHKTKHFKFIIINWISLAIHIAIGMYLFYL